MYRIGGRQRNEDASLHGAAVGIPPLCDWVLPCIREPDGGQCQAGSLTGAVASERVSEALKGSPQNGWKPFVECKGIRELDCETDGSSSRKLGLSDPVV